MGKLTVESIGARDFPVIFAVIIVTSVFTIAGNMIAELCYRKLDPRIR
jgi:peptide/nickel transport system permease protein